MLVRRSREPVDLIMNANHINKVSDTETLIQF